MDKAFKRISSHGSVNIPVQMRRELGLEPRDPLEVSVNRDGDIVLQPYVPRCIFCGGREDVHRISGRYVCTSCARYTYETLVEVGK